MLKDTQTLYKYVDKSALPEDLGGSLPHSDVLAEVHR